MSPFFSAALRGTYGSVLPTDTPLHTEPGSVGTKRIALPDEEPEIFSSVLEYFYKGDYYPRLVHNKRRNSWEMETPQGGGVDVESTVYHHGLDGDLLKDTVIYCAAQKYGLDDLKKIALRKQGLRKYSVKYSVGKALSDY